MSDQENRLAQLKQLQDQLQAKLFSQLSSYNDNGLSEEIQQEIAKTLLGNRPADSVITSSRHGNEYYSVSNSIDTSHASPEQITPPSANRRVFKPLHSPLETLHIASPALHEAVNNPSADVSHVSLNDIKDAKNNSNSESIASLPNASERPLSVFEQRKVDSAQGLKDPLKASNDGIKTPESPENQHSNYLHSYRYPEPPLNIENISLQLTEHSDTVHNESEANSPVTPCSPYAGSNGRGTPSPRLHHKWRHSSPSPPLSPVNTCEECLKTRTHFEQLLVENDQWKLECTKLEKHVEDCMSINKNLMEKNTRLLRRIANFQQECESKEQLVSFLQSRMATQSEHLKGQDQTIVELKERIVEMDEELGCISREKKDLKELLHQTTSELAHKSDVTDPLETKLKTTEYRLHNTENKLADLHDTLIIMKDRENQFQSTVYNMEEEIKSLRHINNRLNSHATHFRLGDMDNSTIAYNITDESKLVSPPRVATGDGTRPSLTSSSPRSSDGNKRLLTRKKWLESSEGGFIFGSPSQTKEHEVKEEKENNPSFTPLTPRNAHSSLGPRLDETTPIFRSPVENVLQSIKDGKVTGIENSSNRLSGQMTKSPKEKVIEERVEARMKMVPVVEKKLTELQKEREKLEYILQRAPSGKMTLQSKQMMMEAEARLDDVMKEIGSARLFLLGSTSWKK